ncbi:MAG: pyroglutamyl-peptidase I [Clostridia bacterium]|nr:pyroglutamyl-peptidase I [Clostridia bacterium]
MNNALPTILVTAFEPFGGEKTNASFEAVRLLPEELCGFVVRKELLPVVFGMAGEKVVSLVEELKPSLVLCTGVAGGRTAVTPEKIAVNWRQARIPDNEGNQPEAERIDPAGPDGIFSGLPVERIVEELREKGYPAEVSYTAGTYVCNDVFYLLMDHLRKTGLEIPAGFIHVPPESVLDSVRCVEALETALRVCMAEC